MADDSTIGTLGIQIEADASDLPGQFDAAVAQAEAAGQGIAQGINQGASGFQGLADGIDGLNTVLGGLKALGIGTAIEQLGAASLEAYGDLQKATIALTSLTGSAAQAQNEISGLRTMAQDDALSFPSLVSANQRFTALGVAANQIPGALTAAANASAAMNVSFDTAANAIERITSSGTLSSRVLVQLGISLQDVAQSMGVSSSDVVKDFKAITDEGERLSILTDAMSKLQGTADAVADSLSGSFQRVQNTLETTFQQIGASIAPAASDLANLAQVVIPEVGNAIQDLAAPAVSIVEFGKALVDAKDSISSLVDAATGLPGTFDKITEAAKNTNTSLVGSLVPSLDVVKQGFKFLTDQIEAYVNEGPNLVTMGNLITDNLDKQTKALKVGGQGFQDAQKNATAFIGSEDEISKATTDLVVKANALQKSYQDMSVALKNNTTDAAGNVVTANDIAEAYNKWLAAQAALNALNPTFAESLGGLTEAYNKNRSQIDTLTTSINQLIAIQNRSVDQENILDGAISKRWDLIQKNITALKDQMGAENDAVTAAAKLTTSANDLLVKEQAVGIALANAKSILDQLTSSSDTSAEHQRAVIDAMNQYATAAKNAGVATNGFATMMVNGALVSVNIDKAIQDLKTHTADFGVTVANVPKEGDSFIGFVKQSADGTVNFNAQLLNISKTLTDNVTLLTTRAIPAYQSFADIHKQLGTAADGAQSALQRMNNETQNSLNNADSALNANSGLANSITHVGDATQGALDIENAWDNNSGPTVDHNSALANSFNSVATAAAKAGTAMSNAGVAVKQTNGSLSQFVSDTQVGLNGTNGSLSQFASDATSSMGAAGDSFKATTSEVDGLNFAASALADTMSGLAALSGTGMNFATGQGVDQAWAVAHAMGLPGYQNVTMTTPLTGDLKGSTDWLPAAYKGVTDLSTAASTLATTSASTTTSVDSLSSTIRDLNASATQTSSTTDGLTTSFTTANQAVDFAGMTGTQLGAAIGKLGTELLSAGVVVDGAGLSAVDYATKLQSTVDGMNASAAAVQQMSQASQSAAVGIATAAAVVEAAGAMVSGVTKTVPSQQMQDALTNMTSLATPGTTDLGSKIPNILATFNGQVITGSPGMSLSSALATQDLGIGSGSSSTGPMPLYTGAPQPTAQPITVNMNYPVFSSQGQSQQTMKDIVSQIRTVTGIKQ